MCEILGEEKPGYLDGFVQTLGPVSFQVRLSGGRLVRHHQNQIRKRMDAALSCSPSSPSKTVDQMSDEEYEVWWNECVAMDKRNECVAMDKRKKDEK